MKHRGNCYVTCEALYHLLGGKKSGWKPMVVKHEGTTHWFLLKLDLGFVEPVYSPHNFILDPTVRQFKTRPKYHKARGCGFLTKGPSKRARALMKVLVWQ